MEASLFGAFVGGIFAILGGWFAVRWGADREARGIAESLVAELSTAEQLMAQPGGASLYQQLLTQWKETGEVANKDILVDIFDNDPQDALPVYYAVTPKLGLLPPNIAANVVSYHAKVIAVTRIVVRLLGKYDLHEDAVKSLAHQIEDQLGQINALRPQLITDLTAFASTRFNPLPARGRTLAWGLTAVLLVAEVILLTSGQRILIWQRFVAAGQPAAAEGFQGRKADAPSIECWYFTGRSVRSASFWYSSNGIMGKDECPFITKPDD